MGYQDFVAKQMQKRLDKMSPEDRAKFDAKNEARTAKGERAMARVEAGIAKADAEFDRSRAEHRAKLDAHVLQGPAGAALHGVMPDAQRPSENAANAPSIREQLRDSFADLKDTAGALASDPLGLVGYDKGFRPTITDHAARERVGAAEAAERARTRAPYVAREAAGVTFTRIATRGATQLDEVAAYLGKHGFTGRPESVFGVYRVPDRLNHKRPGNENGRTVEWDIVHASLPPGPPTPEPVRVRFDGEDRWINRRYREPLPLDEDLALAWMAQAGIGPERCLGIARDVVIQMSEGGILRDGSDEGADSMDVYVRVRGVNAFVVGDVPAPVPLIAVPFDGVPSTHVEVLNWSAVAVAVQPRPQRPPDLPSPWPYLPATPQEVLSAYLDVVGVQPRDCYGAEVTTDGYFEIGETTNTGDDQWSLDDFKLTDAMKLPCADGRDRPRLQCGTRIVISYRDAPEYAVGRDRWAAYQRDAWCADLSKQTGSRRPIEDHLEGIPGGGLLRKIEKVQEKVERFASLRGSMLASDKYRDQARYCEPLER